MISLQVALEVIKHSEHLVLQTLLEQARPLVVVMSKDSASSNKMQTLARMQTIIDFKIGVALSTEIPMKTEEITIEVLSTIEEEHSVTEEEEVHTVIEEVEEVHTTIEMEPLTITLVETQMISETT